MGIPDELYLKRADILHGGLGVTQYALDKAIRHGVLQRRVFPGMSYGRFSREDVVRLFGKPEKKRG